MLAEVYRARTIFSILILTFSPQCLVVIVDFDILGGVVEGHDLDVPEGCINLSDEYVFMGLDTC